MRTSNKQPKLMHFKAARIAGLDLSPNDMAQINQYALSPLTPEEVFAFKVSMAANEVDRDFEVFPRDTLMKFANLFVGKTVVKDHDHRSDNQIARIYATDLTEGEHMHLTKTGEIHTQLIARCYMVKTSTNADLIAEIQAGIRKEVSLGCRIGKAICSICGTDNVKTYCKHFPGKQYDGNLCYFSLEDPTDAYELSFVAIPAQQHAGTVKSYGTSPCYVEDLAKTEVSGVPSSHTEEQTKTDEPTHAKTHEAIAPLLEEISELKLKLATIASHLTHKCAHEDTCVKMCAECSQNAPECADNAPECSDCAPKCADNALNETDNAPHVADVSAHILETEPVSADNESDTSSHIADTTPEDVPTEPHEEGALATDESTSEAVPQETLEGVVDLEPNLVPNTPETPPDETDTAAILKAKEASARLRALDLSLMLKTRN